MKTPAVTQRAKTILILSMLVLAAGGSLAAQSGTKDRVRKRAHRIFAAQTGPDQVTLAWDEVPGATEYRIYLPDPNKPEPPAPGSRPTMSFSGSGRRATVMGVRRMAGGAYLEALGQGEVLYRGTFNAIARAPLARPTAPAAVQARETGETEVTLSWNPVPGAAAYMISRAVGGSGWQMLCDVCPPSGEFVDTTATPGLEHTYTVAAIFPLGISTRTPSNRLTVGAAQLAAVTASAPPAAVWDKPMSTGTPVAGTDADNTNVGASAGTPTTGTTTTTTGTTTGTTTTGTGTTTPSTGSTSNPCTPVVMPKTGTATIYTKPMASGTPVAGTDADNTNVGASAGTTTGTTADPCTPTGTGTDTGTGTPPTGTGTPTTGTGTPTTGTTTPDTVVLPPAQCHAESWNQPAGSVWVNWPNSLSSGVVSYMLYRSINGGPFAFVRSFLPTTPGYADGSFSAELFTAGPVRVRYYVVAGNSAGVTSAPSPTTAEVEVKPPVTTQSSPSCKLNYQRADNMWANFGRADGNLGVESISLANAQAKIFVTDWTYEKQRNDGVNYYGSHLRLATNAGVSDVRLRVRNPATALGAILAPYTTGWLILKPGVTAQFRDDLMEVHCGQ